MVNLETKCAWDAHQEYFEYYAFECPEDWLELSKNILRTNMERMNVL